MGERHHQVQSRQQRAGREDGQQHAQEQVAHVAGERGEGVGAEQPEARRKVVAVGAQERDLGRLLVALAGLARRQELLHLADGRGDSQAAPLPGKQGREPGADVAAARDGGQVVQVAQGLVLRQRLDRAETGRRAADAAAGQRQPDQGQRLFVLQFLVALAQQLDLRRLRLERVAHRADGRFRRHDSAFGRHVRCSPETARFPRAGAQRPVAQPQRRIRTPRSPDKRLDRGCGAPLRSNSARRRGWPSRAACTMEA